jgi:hypothetical protein
VHLARRRRSTVTAPIATSSFSARSTVSVERFLSRVASVERLGIREPDVCPYRSRTE